MALRPNVFSATCVAWAYIFAVSCGGRLADECASGETCAATCSANEACPDSQDGGASGDRDASASDASTQAGDSGSALPSDAAVSATIAVKALSYDVVDADWNARGSMLALVATRPESALHLYDPTTRVDRVIALSSTPSVVSIDRAAAHAVVVTDDALVMIDLATASITRTCPWTGTAADVALSSAGIAYVAPSQLPDGDPRLHAVDTTTCTDVLALGAHSALMLAFDPTEQYLYAATSFDLIRFDLSAPVLGYVFPSGDDSWGYALGLGLWMGAEPHRIYIGTGAAVYYPDDPQTDPYWVVGMLDDSRTGILWLDEAPAIGRVAFLLYGATFWDPKLRNPNGDATVYVHEAHGLEYVAQYPLSSGHGKLVFSTPNMSRLYVVTTSDATQPATASFAIETLAP